MERKIKKCVAKTEITMYFLFVPHTYTTILIQQSHIQPQLGMKFKSEKPEPH